MPPKQTVATGGGAIFSGPSPAYYDRRAQRLHQSMQMAANLLVQKREQQRRTVEAQAKMIMSDPYAAVTGAGQEWLDKYGEANPIMAAQVKAAMRRGEPILQGEKAAETWMAGATEDNEFRDRARAALDSLPETIPGPPEQMGPMMSPAGPPGGAPPGMPPGLLEMLGPMMSPAGPLPGVQPGPGTPQMQLPTEVPNPERAELEERFAGLESKDTSLARFYALDAHEQELVKMGLLAKGMESPPTINDLMERMTPQAVDSYLAGIGALDAKTVQLIRIRSGQEKGRGTITQKDEVEKNKTAQLNERAEFEHDLTITEIEARKNARLEELQYTRESQRLAREGKATGTAGTAAEPTTPAEAFKIHNEAWLAWKERKAKSKVIVSEAGADYRASAVDAAVNPEVMKRFKWNEEEFLHNDPEPPRVTTNDFNELKKITAALPDQTAILRVLLDDVEAGRKTAAEVLETAREITGTAERAGPVVQFGGEIGETMERTFEKSMSVEPRTQPLVPRGAGGR